MRGHFILITIDEIAWNQLSHNYVTVSFSHSLCFSLYFMLSLSPTILQHSFLFQPEVSLPSQIVDNQPK